MKLSPDLLNEAQHTGKVESQTYVTFSLKQQPPETSGRIFMQFTNIEQFLVTICDDIGIPRVNNSLQSLWVLQ